MKKNIFFLFFFSGLIGFSQQLPWPGFKHYEGKWLDKLAMPVGGIGTGNISIAGNGQWKDV